MLQMLVCLLIFVRSTVELKLSESTSYAEIGHFVSVTCSSDNPNENKFWLKDGIKLESNETYILYAYENKLTLFIRVNINTVGDYICKNQSGETVKYSLHLSSENIQFINCPHQYYHKHGERVLLNCYAVFKEKGGYVLWHKDGRSIAKNNRIKVIKEGLLISGVTYEDDGVYTITGITPGITSGITSGFFRRSMKMKLTVKYGPTLSFNRNYLKSRVSDEISCITHCKPQCNVTLYVNGVIKPIYYEDNNKYDRFIITESIIKFENVTDSQYNITCTADNGFDQRDISQYFITKDVPNMDPLAVIGNLVKWKVHNLNGANITQYFVTIESIQSCVFVSLNSSVMEINVIRYVNMSGHYNVSLVAENAIGKSIPVQSTVFIMLPPIPVYQSTDLVASIVTSMVIVVFVIVAIVVVLKKINKGREENKVNETQPTLLNV